MNEQVGVSTLSGRLELSAYAALEILCFAKAYMSTVRLQVTTPQGGPRTAAASVLLERLRVGRV